MRVQESQVSMSSQYLATERFESNESLRFWVGDGDPSTDESVKDSPLLQIEDRVTLSSSNYIEESVRANEDRLQGTDSKTEILRLLLEKLTGHKVTLLSLSDLEPKNTKDAQDAGENKSESAPEQPSAGFGLAYDRQQTYSETETSQFSSRGVLLTEDGREIRFELQFEMSRSLTIQENTQIRLGDARKMDPLVVNLDGQPALLTDATFSFDLDSDGVEEKIASLGPGKGFLALDKDNNGRITDGRELFGPSSGNGFTDLSSIDADGDGWIDEEDPLFKELGLWQKDSSGNESFLSLKDVGIGAIYAGKIATPFSLRNAANQLQGEVKETGLYLRENGAAGAVQELDLVI